MLKKLKKRFVALATLSAFAVLAVIMTAINVADYVSVAARADGLIGAISGGGGEFADDFGGQPPFKPEDESFAPSEEGQDGRPGDERDRARPGGRGFFDFDAETPFETRYFTVTDDGDGYTVFLEHVAAVDEAAAVSYADTVFSGGKSSGYVGEYRYGVTVADGKKMAVFVDCSRGLATAGNFLFYSVIISLVGLAAVFAVAMLLAGKVVRPIAESYEKQKAFITDAGHELKTPLTIISANNELIALETGESESTEAIARQVDRMNALVRNLTALARLDESAALSKSEFSLSDALGDCLSNFSAAFAAAGKKVSAEIADTDYSGDENLMRRLFTLLFDNALKYSATEVSVRLRADGQKIRITVRNDSVCSEPSDVAHVFDRFYRSAASRASSAEGSGIGLSVAKEIVSLHGGKISASADDGFFTIEIWL